MSTSFSYVLLWLRCWRACCFAGCDRASIRAAAASTCGCGWPRRSRRSSATNLAGAAWFPLYARLLGARLGKDVDLHTLPPVTGMLQIGGGASIEPEVDLAGYWIDGDRLRIGAIRIGKRARIGARSLLGPGATIGREARGRARLRSARYGAGRAMRYAYYFVTYCSTPFAAPSGMRRTDRRSTSPPSSRPDARSWQIEITADSIAETIAVADAEVVGSVQSSDDSAEPKS